MGIKGDLLVKRGYRKNYSQEPMEAMKVVVHNNNLKKWLINELNKLGLLAYKTQANFIFVKYATHRFSPFHLIILQVFV